MEQAGALTIPDALGRLQERIEAARQRAGRRDEVTLVAVTKQVPVERIAEAYRAGVRHFGENRVQEFEDKHRLLVLPSATWHMVGHLQSNKAGQALELFDCVDSLDTLHLAQKLDKAAGEQGNRLPVLIQVHLGDEPSKHGVEPASLAALAEQLAGLPHLAVEGLMTIPPFLEPAERLRPFFHRLRELAEEIDRRRFSSVSMRRLSMGMTHDFEVAVEEGASEVRLGTALFGPRPAR
ncbi:MAG: YggS family pyridoxal phosphate-dependent enzyme [Candidatus Acidiferrales bacterium]